MKFFQRNQDTGEVEWILDKQKINMEALVKSLLGKGREHVYETMQTMVEDTGRVKCMDIKLEEYQIMLDNLKDENKQNKKKIRDFNDDLQYEQGINEVLANELKEKDEEK